MPIEEAGGEEGRFAARSFIPSRSVVHSAQAGGGLVLGDDGRTGSRSLGAAAPHGGGEADVETSLQHLYAQHDNSGALYADDSPSAANLLG
jgi:hypothetical protein